MAPYVLPRFDGRSVWLTPFAASAALGFGFQRPQRNPSNQDDAGRQEGPVPPELCARGGIGGHDTRFGTEDRFSRANRVRAKRPHDLDVVVLAEALKLVGRQRPERWVRFPRFRDAAHDNLAARNFCEHAPSEGLNFAQEPPWPAAVIRLGPEDQRACLDNRAH